MSTCTDIAPAAGDIFTSEVVPHLHGLYRMALRLTREEQAAEDLLQDTLERAFPNFKRYEPGTNIRARPRRRHPRRPTIARS
jgi:DNA-directed RNA polymerase specialized sigma24 family protein